MASVKAVKIAVLLAAILTKVRRDSNLQDIASSFLTVEKAREDLVVAVDCDEMITCS